MAEIDQATLKRQTDCLHNSERPDWMLARSKNDQPICFFCGESKSQMERRKNVPSFGMYGMFRPPTP